MRPNLNVALRRRPPLRMAGLSLAFVLPALGPLLFAVAHVQSITLSPMDVASGVASTATVTLDAPSLANVAIDLFSNNPTLASVPTKGIVIPAGGRTGSFPVTTGPGTIGCATISATVRNTAAPKSAILFVKPSPPLLPQPGGTIILAANSVSAGDTVAAVVRGGVAGMSVQLTSSSPAVTVPGSVTLVTPMLVNPLGGGQVPVLGAPAYADFTVRSTRVNATTCAVITARIGGFQKRALLKVFKPF